MRNENNDLYSQEAEVNVLGALLLNNDAIDNDVAFLRAEHFYLHQNQVIFKAMQRLFKKGSKCDTFLLTQELGQTDEINAAGGPAYIAALTDTVPSAANIEFYAKIVHEKARLRQIVQFSRDVSRAVYEEKMESSKILEDAEKELFRIANTEIKSSILSMKEVIPAAMEEITNAYERKLDSSGLESGFKDLDDLTNGFHNSEFVVIGARPSMGKTSIALNMMEHIAFDKNISCGFFSSEMSYEQIGQRILSERGNISGQKLRNGMMTKTDFAKLGITAESCQESPLYVVDTPNIPLSELRIMARRMKSKLDVKIIFIDYIGLITLESGAKLASWERTSEISKALKALARELNIPVVALCQVARDAEGDVPTLAQLRGSGSIEQDADVVMFIHRERKNESGDVAPVQDARLIVAKQRNGPIGEIPLKFISDRTKFESKEKEVV